MHNRLNAADEGRRTYRFLPGWLFLLFSFLFLTACLGGGDADSSGSAPNLGPLSGEVILICSQTCADRGQCGGHGEGYDVVLAGANQVVVENHDLFFPANVRAQVVNNQLMQLQSVANAQPFNQIFYEIEYDGLRGWVAGWCVAAP